LLQFLSEARVPQPGIANPRLALFVKPQTRHRFEPAREVWFGRGWNRRSAVRACEPSSAFGNKQEAGQACANPPANLSGHRRAS
jgi:hypothetical protein